MNCHFTIHGHPEDLALADTYSDNETVRELRESLQFVEILGCDVSTTPCENECYPRGTLVVENAATREPVLVLRFTGTAAELLVPVEAPAFSMN